MIETKLTNKNKSVAIRRDAPTVIIGERINPTGRKEILAALEAGNFESVRRDALSQVEAGATVLDINAGVPGLDEAALLETIMKEVMSVTDVPLCIDTANPKALESALKLYQGKPLVNSVNGEEKSLESVLPLVKEYGAAVIGLCIDSNGIPVSPEERVAVAKKIIGRATQIGIPIPAPWVNVIANRSFGTVVSETGAANTWSENAHEFRLTPWGNDPVTDAGGEAFYIRDEESGRY